MSKTLTRLAMRQITLTIIILLFPILMSHSQETTDELDTGWEIIERCVGEPTIPPDDWTFDGTILASGWAGIHGINADWDTPHVQIFRQQGWLGVLQSYSPDFRWFAVGIGRANFVRCPQCVRSQYELYRIAVYSTVNRGERYIYERDAYFEYSINPANNPNLVWYDNEHLVLTRDGSFTFGTDHFLWNPATGEETNFDPVISPLLPVDQYFPSPDRSIAIYTELSEVNLVVPETGEILQEYDGTPSLFSVWSPDNQYFASTPEFSQIDIFALETGDIITIMEASQGYTISNVEWSLGSNYLSFQVRPIASSDNESYIVDMQSQEIFSLCTYFNSSAWSPIESQMSVTLPDDTAVYIFDLETWQLFNTGIYHEGRIIGWHED